MPVGTDLYLEQDKNDITKTLLAAEAIAVFNKKRLLGTVVMEKIDS